MTTEEREDERMENEALKSAKEIAKKETKKKATQVVWNAVKVAVIPVLITMVKILAMALLAVGIIAVFNTIINGDETNSSNHTYTKAGIVSIWGCDLTREEFIEKAESYAGGTNYQIYLAAYAGEFYDICTEYDINPCFAYAHAAIETGWGSSDECQQYKNYFGYGTYNGASHGNIYASVDDSIRDYCEWIVNSSTEGTSNYEMNYSKGQEYAEANEYFSGTPANNIYVLFATYAYLGDTHICDEPDFDNPLGTAGYQAAGDSWGEGGRIQIYAMYEEGGLYTGRYKELCGHSYGTDETTLQEKADYVQYIVEMRIKTAQTIFGSNAIKSASAYGGTILETCEAVMYDLLENDVHYSLTQLCSNGIEETSNFSAHPYCCCATYVSVVLYRSGAVSADIINRYGYHSVAGVNSMLNACGWISVDADEAEPGDVALYLGEGANGHVFIYAGDGYIWDQTCGCVSSTGNPPVKGKSLSWETYKNSHNLIVWRMPGSTEDE